MNRYTQSLDAARWNDVGLAARVRRRRRRRRRAGLVRTIPARAAASRVIGIGIWRLYDAALRLRARVPLLPAKWRLPSCRECGCMDHRACVDVGGVPCHWVAPDLCSTCAGDGLW